MSWESLPASVDLSARLYTIYQLYVGLLVVIAVLQQTNPRKFKPLNR